MIHTPPPVVPPLGSGIRLISYYIKGSGRDWSGIKGQEEYALVKILVDVDWSTEIIAMLAREEAIEQGCMPSGTCILYEVVEQEEFFYNRLWTREETLDSSLRALAR